MKRKKKKGDVLVVSDSPHGGNYLDGVKILAGQAKPGNLVMVTVEHDEWCAIFKGQGCNCDPNIIGERTR